MNALAKKYQGRKLSTDELAKARNEIKKAIAELEDINLESGDDYILLKWGTLKSWDLKSDRALELLKEYNSLGSSASAMSQKDTPRQREIICELIDECDGLIQNDWDGDYYTKAEAKGYVRGYNA